MRLSPLVLLAALGLSLAPLAQAQNYSATANCSSTPTGHVDWPASNPVWSFDYVRPTNSSGSDGSGLELRNVYFRHRGAMRLIFRRAHVPILNVEYDGSGCSCFRDWSDVEAGFATDGIRTGSESCLADATPGVVQTTCDSNNQGGSGGDTGSFRAVAIEDFGDELVLTTHMSAGWYRYRVKWHFYLDGRIWPEYSFSAASATCTSQAHRHHAYWRFDFDIITGEQGDGPDVAYELNPTAGTATPFTTETTRTWGNPSDGIFWAVYNDGPNNRSRGGFYVRPSAADLALPVDNFSKFDAMVARYSPTEIDDNTFACAVDTGDFVNGESVDGEDIVFWYRSGALHTAGNPWECDIVGPTLTPFLGPPNPNARLGDGTLGFIGGEAVEAASAADAMPEGYVLERAYPNPFNPSTTVRFQVAQAQHVTLALYDALGRQVAVLFEGFAEANRFESVRVDGSGLPSGTYTVRLEGESVNGSTRVVLLK